MSYLANPTSKLEHGVVKIGDFINVDDSGVIYSPEIIPGPGITVEYTTDFITVSATGADLIHVHGTTTSYTATEDDEYIGVNSTSPVTITLPAGKDGRMFTIKDEHGNNLGKITIVPQSGEKIDNRVSYQISTPYQSINVVFRAGNWWII